MAQGRNLKLQLLVCNLSLCNYNCGAAEQKFSGVTLIATVDEAPTHLLQAMKMRVAAKRNCNGLQTQKFLREAFTDAETRDLTHRRPSPPRVGVCRGDIARSDPDLLGNQSEQSCLVPRYFGNISRSWSPAHAGGKLDATSGLTLLA